MSTARTIRRFTGEPVDDATLARCLERREVGSLGGQCAGLAVRRAALARAAGRRGQGREAVGVPEEWLIAGHVVVGWPEGRHGPLRRRPLAEFVNLDRRDEPADDLVPALRSR